MAGVSVAGRRILTLHNVFKKDVLPYPCLSIDRIDSVIMPERSGLRRAARQTLEVSRDYFGEQLCEGRPGQNVIATCRLSAAD